MFPKEDSKSGKDLKQLKDQQYNRECFECGQRCVTYVDMTLGSFVCTRCCGILRGLDPQHRLKSIELCKFTDEEVNYLKLRGNLTLREYFPDSARIKDCFMKKENEEQHKRNLAEKYCRRRMERFKVEISDRISNSRPSTESRKNQEEKSNSIDESIAKSNGIDETKENSHSKEHSFIKLVDDFLVGNNSCMSEKKENNTDKDDEWGAFVESAEPPDDVKLNELIDSSPTKLKISSVNNENSTDLYDLFSFGDPLGAQDTSFEQMFNSSNESKKNVTCPNILEDPFVGIENQLKKSMLKPSKT